MTPAILSALVCVPLALQPMPQDQGTERVERSLEAMGTRLEISLLAPSRSAGLEASEAAREALEEVEARLSTWRKESELSQLNACPAGTAFHPGPELARELARAFAWRDATGGAFDPTVGSLVDAWDLRGSGRRPGAAELERALGARGAGAVTLSLPHGITRSAEAVRLEEGGFGKGAGLDAALASLRASGVREARVDLGGQTAVLRESSPISLAVAHPDDRSRGVIAWELRAGSIATSGNSERGLRVEGERIGHLLDPRSGQPAVDFGSVTVWCPNAFDADCLSTALYVMGPEQALRFAASHDDLEALVLQRGARGLRARATLGLDGQLHTLDPQLAIEWVPTSSAEGCSPEALHPRDQEDRP